MRLLWLLLIALPAALPPLSPTQQTILDDTDDRSSTIDAAGLYALLENAGNWPADPRAEARRAPVGGSDRLESLDVLRDLSMLRDSPDRLRGEPWLIEGTLESISDAALYTRGRLLTREAWQDLQAWHVRGPNDEIHIVCLTDPPDVPIQTTVGGHRVPADVNQQVRAVGRFYKLITVTNQTGQPRRYPVFVGRSARFTGEAVAPVDGGAGPLLGSGLLLIALVVAAYLLIRFSLRRNRSGGGRQRFQPHQPEDHTDDIEYRTDLPSDPIAALSALEEEAHEAERRDKAKVN